VVNEVIAPSGAQVTSAVVNTLIKAGIQIIGLNVGPENPATRLYRLFAKRPSSPE
jgi:hypothetical protein